MQVVSVLNEAVLLAGFFASGRRSHQERLQWGRAPSLLFRLCTLPQPYLSSAGSLPHLRHLPDILFPTLVAACAGVQRNYEVVEATLGLAPLVQYAQRCRPQNGAPCSRAESWQHAAAVSIRTRFEPQRRVCAAAWDAVVAAELPVAAASTASSAGGSERTRTVEGSLAGNS